MSPKVGQKSLCVDDLADHRLRFGSWVSSWLGTVDDYLGHPVLDGSTAYGSDVEAVELALGKSLVGVGWHA